jgi:hypothetical protein
VDPVPDPLLVRKSDRAGNRTRDLHIDGKKAEPKVRCKQCNRMMQFNITENFNWTFFVQRSYWLVVCMIPEIVSSWQQWTQKDLAMRWKSSGQSCNFGTEISVLIVSFGRIDI